MCNSLHKSGQKKKFDSRCPKRALNPLSLFLPYEKHKRLLLFVRLIYVDNVSANVLQIGFSTLQQKFFSPFSRNSFPSVCLPFSRGRPSIKGVEGISFLLFRGEEEEGEGGDRGREGKGQKAERRGGGGHRRLLLLSSSSPFRAPFHQKSRRGQRGKIALFEEIFFCRKSTFAPLTFPPLSRIKKFFPNLGADLFGATCSIYAGFTYIVRICA